jgi:hypothetical protein
MNKSAGETRAKAPATEKKSVAKLTPAQQEMLNRVSRGYADPAGYRAEKKPENKVLEALVKHKVVKRGKKHESGSYFYLLTSAGKKRQMLLDRASADKDASSTEGVQTLGPIVPDFFQEEDEPALREQVEWLEQKIGVSDLFFAKFLRTPESSFRDWRLHQAALPPDQQDSLRDFWRTVLHLLSFLGMDVQRVKTLLERRIPVENEWGQRHPLAPPWSGSSLRSYLEERGADVLPDVDRWVTGFRFGDPFVS